MVPENSPNDAKLFLQVQFVIWSGAHVAEVRIPKREAWKSRRKNCANVRSINGKREKLCASLVDLENVALY